MKIYACITSTRNAIADGFCDIARSAEPGSLLIVGPGLDGVEFGDDVSVYRAPISRSDAVSGFFKFIFMLINIRRITRKDDVSFFAYSTMPINWIMALILSPNRLFCWSHDPVSHKGEDFYNRFILPIDINICIYIFNAEVLCGSSNVSGILLSKYSGLSVRVFDFPYIGSLIGGSDDIDCCFRDIDILFFGRMEEYKGLATLVEAIGLLRQKISAGESDYYGSPVGRSKDGVNVVFAGKGPLYEYVRSTLSDEYVSVQVIHFPSNEVLRKLILRSKICCFPYLEATGSQVMQTALANGCQVICSRIEPFLSYGKKNSLLDNSVIYFKAGDSRDLCGVIDCALASYHEFDVHDSRVISGDIFSPETWAESISNHIGLIQ